MSEPADEVNWSAVREEYEARRFQPAMICRRYGITASQLRYRRETENWLSFRARPLAHGELVDRMLKVLEKQLRRLDMAKDEPIDKQANILSTHVKTLDKLIELGASRRNVEPTTKKDVTELRNKLAARLEQLRNR